MSHMCFIFSLIKTNHPFLRVLCFLSMLIMYNTDSALLFTYHTNLCLQKVKEKYFQNTMEACYKNAIPMHM